MDFTETPYAEDLINDLGNVLDDYDGLATKETIIMVLKMLLDDYEEEIDDDDV